MYLFFRSAYIHSSGSACLYNRQQQAVLPAAAASAANTAAGTRDKNTEIYVELEALDGRTSQPMVQVVRKGHDLELENNSEQLSLATLRPALDVWARDARAFQP